MTTGEVAQYIGMSQATVIRQINNDLLKGFCIPGSNHRRVDAKDVRVWMSNLGMNTEELDRDYGLGACESEQQVSDLREAGLVSGECGRDSGDMPEDSQ